MGHPTQWWLSLATNLISPMPGEFHRSLPLNAPHPVISIQLEGMHPRWLSTQFDVGIRPAYLLSTCLDSLNTSSHTYRTISITCDEKEIHSSAVCNLSFHFKLLHSSHRSNDMSWFTIAFFGSVSRLSVRLYFTFRNHKDRDIESEEQRSHRKPFRQ